MNDKLKTFTVFWLDGTTKIISGYDEADALMRAGYGGGAVKAIDFISNGDKRNEYSWNKENHGWDRVNL